MKKIQVLAEESWELRHLWNILQTMLRLPIDNNQAVVVILRNAEALADCSFLASAEHTRLEAIRSPLDRCNFILGRMLVHFLVKPREFRPGPALSVGTFGKPHLAFAPNFNLSHSNEYVGCALHAGAEIGFDIETFKSQPKAFDLSPIVAHPLERRFLELLPGDKAEQVFRKCWVRKEAVVKAAGTGLSAELKSINVKLDKISPFISGPTCFRVVDIPLDAAGVHAAIATNPHVSRVYSVFVSISYLGDHLDIQSKIVKILL